MGITQHVLSDLLYGLRQSLIQTPTRAILSIRSKRGIKRRMTGVLTNDFTRRLEKNDGEIDHSRAGVSVHLKQPPDDSCPWQKGPELRTVVLIELIYAANDNDIRLGIMKINIGKYMVACKVLKDSRRHLDL